MGFVIGFGVGAVVGKFYPSIAAYIIRTVKALIARVRNGS